MPAEDSVAAKGTNQRQATDYDFDPKKRDVPPDRGAVAEKAVVERPREQTQNPPTRLPPDSLMTEVVPRLRNRKR